MSTKCTIAISERVHYYGDCFNEDHVFLRLEDDLAVFEASQDHVVIAIPKWLASQLGMSVELYQKHAKIVEPDESGQSNASEDRT